MRVCHTNVCTLMTPRKDSASVLLPHDQHGTSAAFSESDLSNTAEKREGS